MNSQTAIFFHAIFISVAAETDEGDDFEDDVQDNNEIVDNDGEGM